MTAAATTPLARAPRRPLGRRERRKREVHARILEAARGLFARHGFEGTTVERIAAAADVVPATFFNHFPNKRALLGEMANEVVDTLGAILAEELARSSDARGRLLGLARNAGEQIAANHGVARDVVLELIRIQARPGDPPPYLGRIHEPVAAMLREGQLAGEVRRDRDADFLAQMVVGMLNAAVTPWLADPAHPVEQALAEAADFAWHAVGTAPQEPD